MTSKTECSWCHTMVEKPCKTIVECKVCPEPYTLTAAQAERFREIAGKRERIRARPLPIDDE